MTANVSSASANVRPSSRTEMRVLVASAFVHPDDRADPHLA